MWHLGIRKQKSLVILMIIFVLLGIAVTLLANQCNLILCPTGTNEAPALINRFESL